MKHLKSFKLERKRARIGVRLTISQRIQIDEFCEANGILISELTRLAIQQVLNTKNDVNG
jgi:hypothetical protein